MVHKARTFVCFFCLYALIALYIYALNPKKSVTQFKLDYWGVERGLDQHSIKTILLTSDGYIWLGTYDGLVRFDGVRFTTFRKRNLAALKDNVILSLLEDSEGNLWVGTSEGGVTCFKNNLAKHWSPDRYPSLKEIDNIFQDRDNNIWIGSMSEGVSCFRNNRLTVYSEKDGLPSGRVRDFHQDSAGRIWIATAKGLAVYDRDSGFEIYSNDDGPFEKYIICMLRTHDKSLWLGCIDGLYRLKNDRFTYYGPAQGLKRPKIKCLREDHHQNLWIGTDSGGLSRLKNGQIETLTITNGLKSNYVFSLKEDSRGNLWIGQLKGGLMCLRDTIVTPFTTREGLSHNTVYGLFGDEDGSLWIGTEKGLDRLSGNRIEPGIGQIKDEWAKKVRTILRIKNGDLLIGSQMGLSQYKKGNVRQTSTSANGQFHAITNIQQGSDGTIWMVTDAQLIKLTPNDSWEVVLQSSDITPKPFTCFTLDAEGNVWIGTYGDGVFKLDQNSLSRFKLEDGLVHNEVEYIISDSKGYVYICTRGGLSCYYDGRLFNFTTGNGLLENHLRFIMEDGVGCLWLAGRTGLSRVPKSELYTYIQGKRKKLNPKFFNATDGIKSPWFEKGTQTIDGRLWFASEQGLVMIDPKHIKDNSPIPSLVLEKIQADGEPVYIRGLAPGSQLPARLVIPPGKQRLTFQYTALSFVKARKIQFKLKLDGYDRDWVETGFQRSTTYTSLSPGHYTFHVTACNSDGQWNPKPFSIPIYIKPYFYQTPWFYISTLTVLLLLIVLLYRFRVRQLKTREKELASLVEARTADLKERNSQLERAKQKIQHAKELIELKSLQLQEQAEKLKEMDRVKSRFFANISHEFRTPLSLIMGPLEQALCCRLEEDVQEHIKVALSNSQRLLTLINQLLDLSKLDSGKMKISASLENIVPFLKGIFGSFQSLIEQRMLNLLFSSTEEEIPIYFDNEKLDKIMVNLVANAIKFTPTNGRISITAEPIPKGIAFDSHFPEGYLEIIVRDTGIGIPEKQLPYIFDRFYQADGMFSHQHQQDGTGIGLALVKELVELHHGSIQVSSRKGEGTVFTLRLPLGDRHLSPEEIVSSPQGGYHPPEFLQEGYTELTKPEPVGVETPSQSPEATVDKNDIVKDIILLVEDNPDVRMFIRGPLAPLYTVVEATDGQEGVDKALEIIPDLIISDVMMPCMNGYQLCSTLKKDVKTSHIPIILLTAKASNDNIIEGLETGADDYIIKPFNVKILLTRIKNLIDLRRQLQNKIQQDQVLSPEKIKISSLDREFILQLKKVLEKNLSDPDFNVDKLAGSLYMSRATLNRKIRALSGESTNRFIRSYRLKRGAQLLKSNFGNVTEVAYEVGFSSAAYFTKCFKEKFNRLPHRYNPTDTNE